MFPNTKFIASATVAMGEAKAVELLNAINNLTPKYTKYDLLTLCYSYTQYMNPKIRDKQMRVECMRSFIEYIHSYVDII